MFLFSFFLAKLNKKQLKAKKNDTDATAGGYYCSRSHQCWRLLQQLIPLLGDFIAATDINAGGISIVNTNINPRVIILANDTNPVDYNWGH